MCACTEPVRTGIGAVFVEYGRPKWPITMLNHTSLVQKNVCFLAPYACSYDRYEEAFLPDGKKRPYYDTPKYVIYVLILCHVRMIRTHEKSEQS